LVGTNDSRAGLRDRASPLVNSKLRGRVENELRIDQSNSARSKEFPTIETYERHLVKRIIPRWGNLAPLAIKSTEVEKWFLELRKGKTQKKVKPFADPTVDKIRRIMHLVYKHGQRHEFLPRQQEGNPMNWVSQRTTSDYKAVPMTPTQAFEILLNIPEPSVGVAGPDVDGSGLRGSGDVREAGLCLGKVQGAEVEAIEGPGSHASSPRWVSSRVAREDAFRQGHRLRVPECQAQRQEASIRIDIWYRST
jgi:hypothetical protein